MTIVISALVTVEGVEGAKDQMEGVLEVQAMEGVVRANLLPRHQFIELFANVVEHCRWVSRLGSPLNGRIINKTENCPRCTSPDVSPRLDE